MLENACASTNAFLNEDYFSLSVHEESEKYLFGSMSISLEVTGGKGSLASLSKTIMTELL